MNKRYRDAIAMITHDIMKDFQEVGAVNDIKMREFEKNCFVSENEPVNPPYEHQEMGLHNPVTV